MCISIIYYRVYQFSGELLWDAALDQQKFVMTTRASIVSRTNKTLQVEALFQFLFYFLLQMASTLKVPSKCRATTEKGKQATPAHALYVALHYKHLTRSASSVAVLSSLPSSKHAL